MPTFFKMEDLTQEQKDNFEDFKLEYDKIQKTNSSYKMENGKVTLVDPSELESGERKEYLSFISMMHQPGTKSALFSRLLEGKKALKFAPPCSYSYPWYSIIEEDKQYELHEDGDTIEELMHSFLPDQEKRIILNQTSWDLIEKVSKTEAIITYGYWITLGFKWKLSYESIPTTESTSVIIPHHNPELKRITTLEQLIKEQAWHVAAHVENLKMILDENLLEKKREHTIAKYGMGFGSGMFKQQIENFTKIVNDRIEKGLPQIPTEEEIQKLIEKKVQDYLSREYEVDREGNLLIKTWILKKISPEIMPDIYL